MNDNCKLLVVDDEEVICQGCRRIFSRQGFQVETYCDSLEGLKRAIDQDYAAILLDIKMPKMDGIQFLEELRKVKSEVPVILITSYLAILNKSAVHRLGNPAYVFKPFTPEEITQAVENILRPDDIHEKNDSTFVPGSDISPPPRGHGNNNRHGAPVTE